jgi:serine protease 16
LEVDYDICQSAFGVSPSSVNRQNQFTNSMYGGNKLQASRVMYPNGQIDPWKSLGVLSPPNEEQVTLYVTAASHHFWTHTTLPTDDVFVREARVAIWNQVNAWLKE